MTKSWGENYFLLGPYFPNSAKLDFVPLPEPADSPVGEAIRAMRREGYQVLYGYWLREGSQARVLLFPTHLKQLDAVKTGLWEGYQVPTLGAEELVNQVISFGEQVRIFLTKVTQLAGPDQDVMAHFHEWMSASGLAQLRDEAVPVTTVFTTHATLLGRYLAPNEEAFYDRFSGFDWLQKARQYAIEASARLERNAAQAAHVLTAVSETAAQECVTFLGRQPDYIIPNGLAVSAASVPEISYNEPKGRRHLEQFVRGQFLPRYDIQPENTLYFFASGRYEYRNKGFDLLLKALSRLNQQVKEEALEVTIVVFIITRRPFRHLKPEVLEAHARYTELRKLCNQVSTRLGPKLFSALATTRKDTPLPNLNLLVDEDLLRRWRQAILEFKKTDLPPYVTHALYHDDDISTYCQQAGLLNYPEDPVKVVYHPDFIHPSNSLFGLDYPDFVKGCHLGIFPSLYEPWGYTAAECAQQGTPTITTDLSGFGKYVSEKFPNPERKGVHVLKRRFETDQQAVAQLAATMFRFSRSFANGLAAPRCELAPQLEESLSWEKLLRFYEEAYKLALVRSRPSASLY
ncbi:glycogen/starch synthase [Rhabdobacter roseus]|uniref:Glycogen(Starch) synthase n=2 Tax=Rhabdobacter roseus TaxID=1655419 RepID=A0A840TU52_9BACT|nr:glycogen(starch) synthase [Rhabdobacter roseus]